MIDQTPPSSPSSPIQPGNNIRAAEQRRRRFASVWLIPIIALMVTVYLGVRSYSNHGPLVTISLKTADGLSAGQTQVKYKAVTLGTVEEISLKSDRSGVLARVRMTAAAEPMLTEHARFWVVRPRLNAANISSLQTLVSGTYIQLDPGTPSGDYKDHFTGFDNPPEVTPDEPGTLYVLKADRIGPVGNGSAVYYRDMEVGQVISTDAGNGFGPLTLNIFVRSPYDKFVRADSRFWSASGLSIHSGAGGFQIQMQSFQAFMIGGVTFETPVTAASELQAKPKTVFNFYTSQQAAEASSAARKLPFVTYIQAPIKDLAAGSPVEIYGIPVGHVSDVSLALNPAQNDARVRIAFDIQPELAFGGGLGKGAGNGEDSAAVTDYAAIIHQMVQTGMRVKVGSSDLVLGQQVVSLEFVPQADAKAAAPPALPQEGDAVVLPGEAGGLGNVTQAMGDIAAKLNRIPFDSIGSNLNHLLANADKVIGGAELQGAIHSLSITMANARDLSVTAKQSATPALQRLPEISAQLQEAVTHANDFLNSVDSSYGARSDFNRNARRVMDQANDAARSIRLLADYLQRHPEALIQGKSLSAGQPVESAAPPSASPLGPVTTPPVSPVE